MPHQCTNCGRTFDDGSKEMLSGCPDCGGNKFQFAPTTAAAAESFDGDATAGSAEPVTGVESAGVADSADNPGTTDPSTESESVTTRRGDGSRLMPGGSSDASDSAEPSPRVDAGSGVHSHPRLHRSLHPRLHQSLHPRLHQSLHPVIRIHPRSRTNPGPRAGDPTPPNRTPRRRESSPTGRRRRGDPRTDPAHRASRRTRSPSMSSTRASDPTVQPRRSTTRTRRRPTPAVRSFARTIFPLIPTDSIRPRLSVTLLVAAQVTPRRRNRRPAGTWPRRQRTQRGSSVDRRSPGRTQRTVREHQDRSPGSVRTQPDGTLQSRRVHHLPAGGRPVRHRCSGFVARGRRQRRLSESNASIADRIVENHAFGNEPPSK